VKNCTFQNAVGGGLRINGSTVPAPGSTEDNKFRITDANLTVADGSLIDGSFAISPLTSNTVTNRVNPVPAFGQATTTLSPPADGFFTNAKYRGAFEPGAESWLPRYSVATKIGSDKGVYTCVGDLNGDYLVNATDFSLFVGRFGGNCN
jgi:hypothetical protein